MSGPSRSGGDEQGIEKIGGLQHKRHTLNTVTQVSFGTSAGTLASSAGPYKNNWVEAGTKNELNTYFVPDQKKWSENLSSCFEPRISFISFARGSRPPLITWDPRDHLSFFLSFFLWC